jgi:glycosyltransferase involved in cell wall biosynthesis
MRILHFNHYGSNAGGAEGYISDVSDALTAEGHESRLVSFAGEEPDRLMPWTTQVSPAQAEAVLGGIEDVIADFRPDVAYIHVVHDPRVVRWIVGRLPSVAYVHSPYLVCPGLALYLRRSRRVCQRQAGMGCLVNAYAERCSFGRNPAGHVRKLSRVRSLIEAYNHINIFVGSQFMRRQLVHNGLPQERISILAPVLVGTTPPVYMPPSGRSTLLYAGRVTEEKGLPELIRALADVPVDWQLVVAGDGPVRPACERLADELGIARRIRFAGWVDQAGLEDLYRQCAFVVMPSVWPEPYGRIGPEAYAHGRPVVAFGVGGVPDWLESEQTGYLITPGDVKQMGARLSALLESPENQERMGRAALARARVNWRPDAHVEQLIARFDLAIQERTGLAPAP